MIKPSVAKIAFDAVEQSRQVALEAIVVEYEPLPYVGDMEAALDPSSPRVHEDWNDNEIFKSNFLATRSADEHAAHIEEAKRRIAEADVTKIEDIRALGGPAVAFSGGMRANDKALKAFLWEHMYRHYRVSRMASTFPISIPSRLTSSYCCFTAANPIRLLQYLPRCRPLPISTSCLAWSTTIRRCSVP